MAKTVESGVFGVYADNGGQFVPVKEGFKNAIECQRWIKKNVDKLPGSTESYVIFALKKRFNIRTAVKTTVYLDEVGKAASSE